MYFDEPYNKCLKILYFYMSFMLVLYTHGDEGWIYNYACNQCLSPLMLWVRISSMARCTTLGDKVCQWLATGRCFSPDPPASSTNKTDRHDITEILLKVALNTITTTNHISSLFTCRLLFGRSICLVFSLWILPYTNLKKKKKKKLSFIHTLTHRTKIFFKKRDNKHLFSSRLSPVLI